MTTKIHRSLVTIFSLVYLGISSFSIITAQCKEEITIKSIRRVNPYLIAVQITTPTGISDKQKQSIETPQNWLVFNPDALGIAASITDVSKQQQMLKESVMPVSSARLDETIESPITSIEVFLKLKYNLLDQNNYLVRVNNLGNSVCLQAPYFLKAVANNKDKDEDKKDAPKKTVLAKVKDKKEADIFIQGLAEGANKSKTFFTIDALVKRKFPTAPRNYFEPFFQLKTSTKEKADPDSASLGVNYVRTYSIDKESSSLQSFDFTNGVKLESDTDFKNVNIVYQTRGDFVFRELLFDIADHPINIIPFIGFELGKNLKSPVPEAENNLLARPLFGTGLYFQLFRGKENNKVVIFETQYIRRILLKPEVAFDFEDNAFVALPISSKPRDYIKSSLNFQFTKNFRSCNNL